MARPRPARSFHGFGNRRAGWRLTTLRYHPGFRLGAVFGVVVGFFLAAYLLTFTMADDDVSRINREANRVDRRSQPLEVGGDLDGIFDCEDFSLLKRRRLIEAGVAASDLHLWAVTTYQGTRHMVLEVRGIILDNLTPWALPRDQVTYYTNWSRRSAPSH